MAFLISSVWNRSTSLYNLAYIHTCGEKMKIVTHYDDVIMDSIASQITNLTIVYSTVHSGADQSIHQSSASLAFVWEIHRWPVNFPHKWPVTRKMFPFDDVIMVKWRHCNDTSTLMCPLSVVIVIVTLLVLEPEYRGCWFPGFLCRLVIRSHDIDGLMQGRRNASVLAMKLRLSCINSSILSTQDKQVLVFYEEEFQQSAQSQCWEDIR